MAEDKKGVFCNIGICGKLLWGCEICQVANTTHGKRTRRQLEPRLNFDQTPAAWYDSCSHVMSCTTSR